MGEKPTIRLATQEDASACLEIYRPHILHSQATFEIDVPTEEEFADRLRNTLERYPWFVAEINGVVAGYAYASAHRARAAYRWSVEESVYISPQNQRQGMGRTLLDAVVRTLALQGYRNAYAVIALPNPGSVTFHEALGFEPVGVCRSTGYKLGRWHDVGWWQKRLESNTESPGEPRSPKEVLDRNRHILTP